MKNNRQTTPPVLIVLLVALAGIVGYQTNANRGGAPLSPAVVATVDLERLFDSLDERSAANAALTKLAQDLDAEGTRKREEIEMLGQDLEMFQPGSAEFNEKQEKLVLSSGNLKAYLDFASRKIDVRQSRVLHDLYQKIKDTVSAMAAEDGYDVVFVDDSVVTLPESGTENEMMRQISARRMLYTNPQIDITVELAARMNREFGGG